MNELIPVSESEVEESSLEPHCASENELTMVVDNENTEVECCSYSSDEFVMKVNTKKATRDIGTQYDLLDAYSGMTREFRTQCDLNDASSGMTKDFGTQCDLNDILYDQVDLLPSQADWTTTDFAENPFHTFSPVARSRSADISTSMMSCYEYLEDHSICEVDLFPDSKDQSFKPSETTAATATTDSSMSECDENNPSPITDSKYIVFGQCLQKVFKWCIQYGKQVTDFHQYQSGSCLSITTVCVSHHTCNWQSQR